MQKLTFRECVIKVKEIYERSNNVLDNMVKLDVIQQHLRRYFEDEEPEDVFEGFVNFVVFLDKISTAVAKQHDMSLVKSALIEYHEFLKRHPELADKHFECDPKVIDKSLKILIGLKFKHAQTIIDVYHMKNAKMIKRAIDLVSLLLQTDNYTKGIQWMAILNIRDQFPFEKLSARLISENEMTMLDLFVGEEEYRGRRLIKYVDKLIECYWKRKPGIDMIEQKLIDDHKRLLKLSIRYLKNFKLADSEIPNVMNVRAFEALMYHHYAWKNGERSWNNFEELALPPISGSAEIRDRYFNLLCEHGMPAKALHFAHLLNLPMSSYPPRLKNYVQQNPEELANVQDKISKNMVIRKQNEQIEINDDCCLDNGKPIILVDTYESFDELTDLLRKGEERLIGIDAEWRPHFLSTTERISLIQIANSKNVYLVDVLWLDEKMKLDEDSWSKFFEALFCTKEVRKVGYDFRNDIRVLKSTFPFITDLLGKADTVICLYKLMQQIVLLPEATKVVFGGQAPRNLGLSDISQYFLGVQLQKSEREGNWSQRPLRLEQKKYAALDAHCLVEIYQKIAPSIRTLAGDLQSALQECALINFKDEQKTEPASHILSDGQVAYGSKEKEHTEDFVTNIQKVSADLLNNASGSSKLVRSTDDVGFIADSMLFGLGKNLRKCGFDTRLMGDRQKIIDFCRMENNQKFIVLSTGKGHKQLESMLGASRVLHVPVSTHTGALPPSHLVNHVMRELKIAIRPDDMWSRCVECNKRAFVPVPLQIVRVLFYMNAVRAGAEWLEIKDTDLREALQKLRDESELTEQITPEMHNGEQPRHEMQLDEFGYYYYEDKYHIICETRHCAVDIINKLMLAENRGAAVSIQLEFKYKKDTFDEPNIRFYICAECGRVQYSHNNDDEE